MTNFKELFEAQEWIIYDPKTGESNMKRYKTHKGAKNAKGSGVIASIEWYVDNKDNKDALIANAKRK